MARFDWTDTIAACAAREGDGARSIVRISGPRARAVVAECIDSAAAEALAGCAARKALLSADLILPPWRRSVRVRLYLWPQARSYTGQEVCELHLPCSAPLVAAALDEFARRGARIARPGEFTLRAFLSGRLDLAQAEGVLGVIHAESVEALRAAVDRRTGGLSRAVLEIRSDLLDLVADLEAGLDFSHEDVEPLQPAEIDRRLQLARRRLAEIRSTCSSRRIDARPPRVVLVGPPNAGKSSLLNALADAPRSIVHEAPGTTRDVVGATAIVEGRRIEILDTAGEDEGPDEILRSAERLREREAHDARLLVVCRPADAQVQTPPPSKSPALIVRTKSDLATEGVDDRFDAAVSIHDPASIRSLARLLSDRLADGVDEAGAGGDASERVAASLDRASSALDDAGRIHGERVGDEFLAAALRAAVRRLGEIVGDACTEDLLDRVFSRFCIGK